MSDHSWETNFLCLWAGACNLDARGTLDKEDPDQAWETTPCGPKAHGSKLVLMDLSQVRIRPVRSRRAPAFWFTNITNLKQWVTHPEWGLWKSGTLTKDPKSLLSAPREYKNTLV